jgi:hypothetical protein
MDNKTKKKSHRLKIPWWLHLLLAIAAYCFLKFLAPTLSAEDNRIARLLLLAPQAAPIAAIAFLFFAASALYRDDAPEDEDNTPDPAD